MLSCPRWVVVDIGLHSRIETAQLACISTRALLLSLKRLNELGLCLYL